MARYLVLILSLLLSSALAELKLMLSRCNVNSHAKKGNPRSRVIIPFRAKPSITQFTIPLRKWLSFSLPIYLLFHRPGETEKVVGRELFSPMSIVGPTHPHPIIATHHYFMQALSPQIFGPKIRCYPTPMESGFLAQCMLTPHTFCGVESPDV